MFLHGPIGLWHFRTQINDHTGIKLKIMRTPTLPISEICKKNKSQSSKFHNLLLHLLFILDPDLIPGQTLTDPIDIRLPVTKSIVGHGKYTARYVTAFTQKCPRRFTFGSRPPGSLSISSYRKDRFRMNSETSERKKSVLYPFKINCHIGK